MQAVPNQELAELTGAVVERVTLEYEVASSRLRPGPRYTPRDIAHLFAGFRVQNSYLLKNGFQEYVFARE